MDHRKLALTLLLCALPLGAQADDLKRVDSLIHALGDDTQSKRDAAAAEIIKLAMIKLDQAILDQAPEVRLLLQVHDELVVSCPKDQAEQVAKLLQETMEGAVDFKVPLTAEAHWAKNWKEAK